MIGHLNFLFSSSSRNTVQNIRMSNSTTTNSHPFFYHPDYLPIFAPITTFSLLISFINFATICIMLRSKSLSGPGNYAVLSILLGSAVQALVTIPTYTFKRLNEGHLHREGLRWLCDFYRVTYFMVEHGMKLSLLHVSLDRLIATIRPYKYREMMTKRLSATVVIFSWLIVLFVDIVPFFPIGKIGDKEGCTYVPSQVWGVSVILLFNIGIFVLTFINYTIIWKTTAAMTLTDRQQRRSVSRLVESTNEVVTKVGVLNPHDTKESITKRQKASTFSIGPRNRQISKLFEEERKFSLPSMTTDMRNLDDCLQGRGNSLKLSQSSTVNRSRVDELEWKCDTGSCKRKTKFNRSICPTAATGKSYNITTASTGSTMSLRLAFEMKSTRTAFAIFIVYIVCWGWLGIVYLIDNFCGRCVSKNENLLVERLAVKVASFSSSLFLPLVYCWKTRTFRKEIRRLSCVRCVLAVLKNR